MVSKSCNWGCSPSKWPKWFINGGYSLLTVLTGMIPQVFLGGDGAGGGEYKNWIPHRESHQNLISKIFNWLPALADFNCPSKKKTDGCNLSSLGLNLMILGGLKEQIINRVSPPSLSTGNWSRHVVRVVSNHGSFPHLNTHVSLVYSPPKLT